VQNEHLLVAVELQLYLDTVSDRLCKYQDMS
jgi:hypothetical protein